MTESRRVDGLSAVDHAQDLHGWFYRALAPGGGCAVLEVGDANAGAWFSDVTRGTLGGPQAPPAHPRFDAVLVHATLGGCATLSEALARAHGLLRPGGAIILLGVNRLRPGNAQRVAAAAPRATAWGWRRALSRAGFADVGLYVAHPPGTDAVYMIDVRRRSARAFFRSELEGRQWPVTSPKRWLFTGLVELGLMPYLQPGFVVAGRRC